MEINWGKIAFNAYVKAKSGTTYDGKPIPKWEELGDDVRSAWTASAMTIYRAVQSAQAGFKPKEQ